MLKELDDELIVVANADCKEVLKSEFKIIKPHCFKNRTLRYLVNAIFTFWLILRYRPRLIVVHWASRIWQCLALSLFAKKIIVHTMGGDIDGKQDAGGWKKFFTYLLLRRCKLITVKSEYMKEMLLSNFDKLDKEKIKIISWGVENRFANHSKTFTYMDWLASKKNNRKIFFCIRSMNRFYHKREIVESFLDFKKQTGSDAILLISTSNADPKYMADIIEIVGKTRFVDDIFFAHIPHEFMHEAIHLSDYVISYTDTDGLSQSILESMAACKIVIAKDIPNNAEFIKKDVNGILFENESELSGVFAKALNIKYDIEQTKHLSIILDLNLQTRRYIEILKDNFYK
ncbi:MAG: glycosyltransferase [Campylobacterales bacterium]